MRGRTSSRWIVKDPPPPWQASHSYAYHSDSAPCVCDIGPTVKINSSPSGIVLSHHTALASSHTPPPPAMLDPAAALCGGGAPPPTPPLSVFFGGGASRRRRRCAAAAAAVRRGARWWEGLGNDNWGEGKAVSASPYFQKGSTIQKGSGTCVGRMSVAVRYGSLFCNCHASLGELRRFPVRHFGETASLAASLLRRLRETASLICVAVRR